MQASKMTTVTGCSSPFPASWLSSVWGEIWPSWPCRATGCLGKQHWCYLGMWGPRLPCSPALPRWGHVFPHGEGRLDANFEAVSTLQWLTCVSPHVKKPWGFLKGSTGLTWSIYSVAAECVKMLPLAASSQQMSNNLQQALVLSQEEVLL